jgi:hypothetical protein
MSVYLSKGVHSFGEAETVVGTTAKTSGTNPPWVGVTFHQVNPLTTFTLDGEAAAATYYGGTTVYGEITAITGGEGRSYTLYKAKVDH